MKDSLANMDTCSTAQKYVSNDSVGFSNINEI